MINNYNIDASIKRAVKDSYKVLFTLSYRKFGGQGNDIDATVKK